MHQRFLGQRTGSSSLMAETSRCAYSTTVLGLVNLMLLLILLSGTLYGRDQVLPHYLPIYWGVVVFEGLAIIGLSAFLLSEVMSGEFAYDANTIPIIRDGYWDTYPPASISSSSTEFSDEGDRV